MRVCVCKCVCVCVCVCVFVCVCFVSCASTVIHELYSYPSSALFYLFHCRNVSPHTTSMIVILQTNMTGLGTMLQKVTHFSMTCDRCLPLMCRR